MLQYLFESCLASWGPPWSRKISYNSNSWFRRDSKQRVSIISEPVLFIYLSWIVICNTGLLSKPFVSQPKRVWWFPCSPGFSRLQVWWNCFGHHPESSQQKRSKKVCDKYDTSWVTRYNFMNVCEYLIKQKYL